MTHGGLREVQAFAGCGNGAFIEDRFKDDEHIQVKVPQLHGVHLDAEENSARLRTSNRTMHRALPPDRPIMAAAPSEPVCTSDSFDRTCRPFFLDNQAVNGRVGIAPK